MATRTRREHSDAGFLKPFAMPSCRFPTRRLRCTSAALALLAAVLAAGPARAESVLQRLASSGELVVGSEPLLPPSASWTATASPPAMGWKWCAASRPN